MRDSIVRHALEAGTRAVLAIGLVLSLHPMPGGGASAEEIEQRPPILLDADTAQLVTLPEPARTVAVANPDIADVQIPNPTSFLLLGKKPGTTNVYVISQAGKTASYLVTVHRPIAELKAALLREVPEAQIEVAGTPNGVMISGSVASPLMADRLKTVAQQYLGDKEDLAFNVAVRESTQVNLRIRVAEVSREVSKRFGFNWAAIFNNGSLAFGLLTGRAPMEAFGDFIRSTESTPPYTIGGAFHSGSVDAAFLIDALQQEGLITILAEPNLTALSGETANFLAGGEFPIPVPQGLDQITIEFKRFGVSVDFTPTVLDANRLSIKVRAEVSELSDEGAIKIASVEVPSLRVRRAGTTVDLGSGQSFAIAGLFQNNVNTGIDRYPWLGDIPILGALFRSNTFQRNESELVIIVTPYVVRPVDNPTALQLPTDGIDFASDLERLMKGRLTARSKAEGAQPPASAAPPPPSSLHLHGTPGFMME